MTLDQNRKPIEVWLTQDNLEMSCRIVFNDETITEPDVRSVSMRGAQREVTGWLISQGYEPAGRWQLEDEYGFEAMRLFRRPALQTITQQLLESEGSDS
jgi:hypothetical protein